jgi:hypothetical protein
MVRPEADPVGRVNLKIAKVLGPTVPRRSLPPQIK